MRVADPHPRVTRIESLSSKVRIWVIQREEVSLYFDKRAPTLEFSRLRRLDAEEATIDVHVYADHYEPALIMENGKSMCRTQNTTHEESNLLFLGAGTRAVTTFYTVNYVIRDEEYQPITLSESVSEDQRTTCDSPPFFT